MNWKQAFTPGLLAPGVWGGVAEATMYSYNGFVLPKIPTVEGYPYAMLNCIFSDDGDGNIAQLYLMTSPCVVPSFAQKTIDGSYMMYQWCDSTELIEGSEGLLGFPDGMVANKWCKSKDVKYSGETLYIASGVTIEWANFDIISKTDNSVYFAASDPVPVYE